MFYSQSAPERTQKDTTKTSATSKMTNGLNVTTDEISESVVSKENLAEVTNGYANTNGCLKTSTEGKQQESNRQRTRKDEKFNAEFINQITVTMQNLQRDLDRITARVRSLEGQALQALAPQTVSITCARCFIFLIVCLPWVKC